MTIEGQVRVYSSGASYPWQSAKSSFPSRNPPKEGTKPERWAIPYHTQAETMSELKEAVKDAVRCHFDDDDQPKLIRLHLVKDEVIRGLNFLTRPYS